MAPPSFLMTCMGHSRSLSCEMLPILDSLLVVISTLPYPALFPKGLGGTACQAFPSPAFHCPAVLYPQESSNASLLCKYCTGTGPRWEQPMDPWVVSHRAHTLRCSCGPSACTSLAQGHCLTMLLPALGPIPPSGDGAQEQAMCWAIVGCVCACVCACMCVP